MIGKRVEFPTGIGCWDIGIVTSANETTGEIEVRTEEGELFKGPECLVTLAED